MEKVDIGNADIGLRRYTSQHQPTYPFALRQDKNTFAKGQCKIERHQKKKAGGCPVAKIRLNGRWYKFWLSRPIVGDVQRVTVKQDNVGDWFITLLTDAEYTEDMPKTGNAAGHDFGLKTFLTSSDGSREQSPEFY